MVDEPQGAIYGGTVAAPAFGEIMALRAAVPADPAVRELVRLPGRAMDLRELFGSDAPPVEVTALAYDNRAVGPGTLFFCVRGLHARRARLRARRGRARARRRWSSTTRSGSACPRSSCADVRAAMAPAAARFHGDPTARLQVVGITGTNGKTTTAFLVRALLEAAGRQDRAARAP